jgi:ubiquitin-protein ligase
VNWESAPLDHNQYLRDWADDTALVITPGDDTPMYLDIDATDRSTDVAGGGGVEESVFELRPKARAGRVNRSVPRGKLRVYSTLNFESMVTGDEIDLTAGLTLEQAENAVRAKLRIGREFAVHLFLSGGLRFSRTHGANPNTADGLFKNWVNLRQRLYAVVTRPIPDALLTRQFPEGDLCDCRDPMKPLLSPICASTDVAYTHIAVLLGYLHSGSAGDRGSDLVQAIAAVTDFAPLVCGIARIHRRELITGLTIATICASYHCLIGRLLPGVPEPNRFEFALRTASWLVHLPVNRALPATQDIRRDGSPNSEYLRLTGQDEIFVLYSPDQSNDIEMVDLKKEIDAERTKAIETIFEVCVSFRPCPPLTARVGGVAMIVQHTKGNVILSYGDDPAVTGNIRVRDPRSDAAKPIDPEGLAALIRVRGDESTIPLALLPEDVVEIIQVCVDLSESMKASLANQTVASIGPKDPATGQIGVAETSRMEFLWQLMESFANRLYGFRIPCLMGLIAFTDVIVKSADFSPLSSDFLSALNGLSPKGQSRLWDALSQGLRNLRAIQSTGKYRNVKRLRILVFAAGADSGSVVNKVALADDLVRANVIVDSVLLSTTTRPADGELTKLCHLTGGAAYQMKPDGATLAIFETESFLASSKRPPDESRPHAVGIVDADFDAASDVFDERVGNFELLTATRKIARLNSAGAEIAKSAARTSDRERRILTELRRAAETAQIDKTIRLYVNGDQFDEWKVWLRGPDGTDYAGKWWYISIVFPELYPVLPPLMRFVTCPYHMNVSEDGRICLDTLCQKYHAGVVVAELITAVKNMLVVPDPRMSVSYKKTWDYFALQPKTDPGAARDYEYQRDAAESADDAIDDVDRYLRGTAIDEKPLPAPAPSIPGPWPDIVPPPAPGPYMPPIDGAVERVLMNGGRPVAGVGDDDCI